MTANTPGTVRTLGTLLAVDGEGVVRLEDRFMTDTDDLWSALTDPRRLARWLGEFEGDLRQGGEFRARYFASGWEGTGRVEVCEPPQRLLIHTNPPTNRAAPSRRHSLQRATKPSWSSKSAASPWTKSPPTAQATRSTSKISPPTSPATAPATHKPDGKNSTPPTNN